jgi:hypothetical protein
VDVGTRVVRRPLAFAFRGPLAWSPDGKRLAVSSRKGLVLLDAATGTTTPLSAPKPGQGAVFSPDGHLLALLWAHNGRDNSVTEGVEVIAAPGARPRPALVVTAPPGFNVTATGWQP